MDNIPTNNSEQPTKSSEPMVLLKQEPKIESKKKMLIAGIPEHIINNSLLSDAIKILPAHYNFEIYKTLLRIETLAA
jgi:hypothetical protein